MYSVHDRFTIRMVHGWLPVYRMSGRYSRLIASLSLSLSCGRYTVLIDQVFPAGGRYRTFIPNWWQVHQVYTQMVADI